MSVNMKPRQCFEFTRSGQCSYGDGCKFEHDLFNFQASKPKRAVRPTRKAKRQRTSSHINSFFLQYSAFNYDPSEEVMVNFFHMCDVYEWGRDDEEKKEARTLLKDAMVLDFNNIYGTDVNDISSWHNLCQILRITPIPGGLEASREIVQQTHVNLVDLVDTPTTHRRIRLFSSVEELSEYSLRTRKIFPKENAKAGGLLRFLLRHIMNPEQDDASKLRGGGGKSGRSRRNF